ncbi:RNA-binding KH domain-containing protein RCF3-like [Oryza brachyantha]|uniref:RNA-binding KH domain-containing protein RCF3-like n=1 Tax=Oryza brachyantha TaxID=4533 RepID=UPI001ADADB0C|nr:RNA-binding KH domain-containing protein RCF3-like [Oryza brachyantha]
MDHDRSRRHNLSTSRKRPHSNSDDRKRKRLNTKHDDGSMSSQPTETIYRILCPVKKIGSVLGRGGDVVKALRDETKAKIRVADSIPGADERVIIIFNYPSQSEDDEAAQNISTDGFQNMKPHCFAQDALLKIHDKIAEDEDLHGGIDHEKSETVDGVTARILVPGNQVGCLLGKGGSIIQQLRNETGAGIRVLPSENLPQCALKSDELVQISGAPSLVRKALYEISTRLHQHPRKDNPPLEEIIDASTQRKHQSPPQLPHANPMLPHLHVDHSPQIPLLDPYRNGPLRYHAGEAEEFSIKILCASEHIGQVIGKSGGNVRQVEQQTGARIQVKEVGKNASGERLIVVSSQEIPDDPVSPTIEALILLHSKVSAPAENRHLTTRLVVPSNKVGCILGEGGKVITEMRRRTGAEIRVYSKADKPKYLSFDEELVQVAGLPAIARGALTEIASRLRTRTLRDGSSSNNPPPFAPFDGPPVDVLPSREFMLYRQSANNPPYGGPANDPPYGRPANDPPYGRPANDPPYGRTAIDPPYGRPAIDPPYGRRANDPPYRRPANDTPYGGLNNDAPHDHYTTYPVEYFSKREYPSGSSKVTPSASYDRYAAPSRLPNRELPSSGSPGANYMSHRSYFDHVPIDRYSSRGTLQLNPLRAENSNLQQLGITRAGNSNAYDYTEAAEQIHGREDYRRLTGFTGYPGGSVELRIPNSYLETVIGVGGANLAEIRQISGARVKLLETHPASSESIVEIQGVPDQVKAAQSLLQGFIGASGNSRQAPQSSRMGHYF